MKWYALALIAGGVLVILPGNPVIAQTTSSKTRVTGVTIPESQITTTPEGLIYHPPGETSITLRDSSGHRPGAVELSPAEEAGMTPEMKANRLRRVQEHQERIRLILEKRNQERMQGKNAPALTTSPTTAGLKN